VSPRLFGPVVLFALAAAPAASQMRPTVASADAQVRSLCEALHTLPAKRKGDCCGTAPASLADACVRELSASLQRGALALAVSPLDRCRAESSRQLQGCDWVGALGPAPPDACREAMEGRLEAGARCRSSLECPAGWFCRGAGPGREGLCAAPGAPGTRCEVPSDTLAAFTSARDDPRHPVCVGYCIKGQCLPFSAAGGPCQSSTQCRPGLNCIAGQCLEQTLPKIGEACPGHTLCDAGAYCQEGRCQALKSAGEACILPFECRAFECLKTPAAPQGTCGNPCGAASPSPSAATLR
jgi:hypothetical protein